MQRKKLNLFVPQKSSIPRVKRVEREIKQILAEIFQKQEIPPLWDEEQRLMPFPGIITITHVKVSADLKECTVFIMPLGNKAIGSIELYFEKAASLIRKSFAQKSIFRFVPHFRFQIDSSFSTAERIEELLKDKHFHIGDSHE